MARWYFLNHDWWPSMFHDLFFIEHCMYKTISENLPTSEPGSTTKTEYEAMRAPSSGGCRNRAASGFWDDGSFRDRDLDRLLAASAKSKMSSSSSSSEGEEQSTFSHSSRKMKQEKNVNIDILELFLHQCWKWNAICCLPLQTRMSHWKCTLWDSGNLNMEKIFASAIPLSRSYTNSETMFLSGHLEKKDNILKREKQRDFLSQNFRDYDFGGKKEISRDNGSRRKRWQTILYC